MIAAILAHQGGWDEMLMVAGPIGIFALILRRANKRAEAAAAMNQESADPDDSDQANDRTDGDGRIDGLDSVGDGISIVSDTVEPVGDALNGGDVGAQ